MYHLPMHEHGNGRDLYKRQLLQLGQRANYSLVNNEYSFSGVHRDLIPLVTKSPEV
jgi:hypothetical protein